MKNLPHITESEWLIMNQLWLESPLTASELVNRVKMKKDLGQTTIKTLLRRLISKDAVGFTIDEKNSKLYYYFPKVSEQDCIIKESQHFLSLYYQNNIKKMFATFVDSAELSDTEIDGLKDLLEQKKGDPGKDDKHS